IRIGNADGDMIQGQRRARRLSESSPHRRADQHADEKQTHAAHYILPVYSRCVTDSLSHHRGRPRSTTAPRSLAPEPHRETVLRASVKGTSRGCTLALSTT